MRRLALPLFALIVLLSACAAGGAGGGAAGGESDVLTAELLAPYAGNTLFDAIDRERRQWLRTRGEDPVKVWLDGRELGGTGELRTILVNQVAEARYLLPRDARRKYGVGVESGVIEVTTR
jgi:hypothetical protein